MNRPELIFFSQYKLGGVQNYYYNIIANDPYDHFKKKWLFTQSFYDPAALPAQPFNICEEKIFPFKDVDLPLMRTLAAEITHHPGLVLTNFYPELKTLQFFGKGKKALVFVCHDDFFLASAREYSFIIDAYIAHNIVYYEKLKALLPGRERDIYFMPYGIRGTEQQRTTNPDKPLRVLFLARFDSKKGAMELFDMDDWLRGHGHIVEWTMIGDGPQKAELERKAALRSNFTVATLPDNAAVMQEIPRHDVFVLPSYLDGLPVSLLETMSAGLVPVLYRFNEGIDQVVDASVGYVLESGKWKEMAAVLGDLDRDRKILDQKGKLAREKFLDSYSIDKRKFDYYDFFDRYKELKRSAYFKYRDFSGKGLISFLKFRLKLVLTRKGYLKT